MCYYNQQNNTILRTRNGGRSVGFMIVPLLISVNDEVTTYYYYKWSAWSAWSDTAYTSGETREVGTQTLYRTRKKIYR